MTTRAFDQQNISADTGTVVAFTAGPGAMGETQAMMRLRVRTNVVNAAGQYLITVNSFDGNQVQPFNAAYIDTNQPFSPGVGGYLEAVIPPVWQDLSQDITIRVQPTTPGGSIDVILLYANM